MRIVYFDCFAGVSGDMIAGALLDLGVDLETLRQQLSSLGLKGCQIRSRRVHRSGISAVKFNVDVEQQDQPERSLADIRSIIQKSSLSETTRSRSITAFERLADAEARVHGTSPDEVHFHEVGAVDSIVDIAGAMIGFELLGVERFLCSALRVGGGLVETEHGRLPIPAPATVELLQGVPLYAGELEGEFVTPTGAAIVATLCEGFGAMPPLKIDQVGYGAGSRDPKGFPNALRLVLGELIDEGAQAQTEVYPRPDETVVVVETNIDDMNPQAYGFVMERAFALGALDVFVVPAQMKKDRPGALLTVLCKHQALEPLLAMLLAETTTLGARYYEAKRRVLERTSEMVETNYGRVRIKVARDGDRTLHFQPEYEDCARLAIEAGVPLLEVQAAASAEYRNKMNARAETSQEYGELKEKHRV
ncbi:MAG TPA: nickel pincer cofactor biosynthesis protein LarC [Blastocatellia bacterium]|nr:nickel pincer cofactor biosynthesis protein LarC [Blastocatellia bacterium]